MTSSRDELWNDRIQEFKSSPFFGIGFASISTKSNNHYYNKEDGKVETGSSWLNILSMTGLIGVFIFCYIWIKTLYLIYINLNRFPYTSSYLAALIIFWSIHMGAEGYIYAAGSFLFFLLWLLIGYIYTIFSHPKYVLLINF